MMFATRPALSTMFVLSLSLAATGTIAPASAHHSLSAAYDTSVDLALEGTVRRIDWRNPHAWIYMDVANDDGIVEEWQCELGSPNSYLRRGLSPDDAPPGTVIIAYGAPARDGSNTCSSRNVTLEDGSRIF
jgi:hypothetical protein